MNCINLCNITKKYGKKTVLDSLNLDISAKSILFVMGANGAGKSTLLRIILNMSKQDDGHVYINDPAIVNNVGSMIGSTILNEALSAHDYLCYYAIAWNIPRCQIQEALRLVGLEQFAKQKIRSFSTGMKQRVAIARALLSEPKLLVLDEPFNGLDPVGIEEIKYVFKALNNHKGTTIVISSHLIEETKDIATHYAILDRGHIEVEFSEKEKPDFLSCICFNSAEVAREVFQTYPDYCTGLVIRDKRNSLFINPKIISAEAASAFFERELGYVSRIDKASLNDLFLGVTGGRRA